jgi:hypothetical protein
LTLKAAAEAVPLLLLLLFLRARSTLCHTLLLLLGPSHDSS